MIEIENTISLPTVVGKTIASALVKAQSDYGPALKSSENPHFRSKYADLAACVEAVVGALSKHGITLMQRALPCESGITVETVFIHSSGETLSSGPLHVPAQRQDAQGYGSALTYARRYSLMMACGIAPEDDDGNAASGKQSSTPTPAKAVAKTEREDKPRASAVKAPISEEDDRIPF